MKLIMFIFSKKDENCQGRLEVVIIFNIYLVFIWLGKFGVIIEKLGNSQRILNVQYNQSGLNEVVLVDVK